MIELGWVGDGAIDREKSSDGIVRLTCGRERCCGSAVVEQQVFRNRDMVASALQDVCRFRVKKITTAADYGRLRV